ncbi:hypothetical protein CDL15_Pgr012619 [Punica granatum]|uniref:Uncharacterized protein n=1 Tax=Punica granatum TaxID=22663 RepID=A0A218Y0A0_PUNGR|nr:hypothetical protein CDL15_Pgr012619 [Punica granatum]
MLIQNSGGGLEKLRISAEMSSSITEGSFYEGKLLIHIAENGRSFELDCTGSMLVDSVVRFVESVSGINSNEQLVLCAETKLEPQRPLSAYKLPSDGREVFIFNKARLQTNSPPPPPEEVCVLEIADPPTPSSSSHPHPLGDSPDPAMKALPSYEQQFRYHFQCGNSVYTRTYKVYEMCERFLTEIKVQESAIEVARTNLEQYYKVINQNYTDFMKRYVQQKRAHSDLLVNFERDLERLRSIKLHPNLQKDSRKCLLDFLKEEELRRLEENCKSSHRQFENKVLQFKQMFGDVKRKVEDLFGGKASLSVRNLERMVKEHQRYINEQRSIMQSLSKDVNTVKKLVDDCVSPQQLSSSLRPHDAVSALGPMYEVHDKNHLPRMISCDRSILKLLELCRDRKNEMSSFLHTYIQRVTYASYVIKDVKLQFPVFREAMVRQDDLFMDLRLVRGLGPAYRACLAEVVRRRSSMKLYMGMAGQLAERLTARREVEVRRREEFLKAQGSYLPRDVLVSMGLSDMPSQCDVNVAPFDADLLDIDVSDIDRYAPEYLAGWPKEFAPEDMRDSTSSSVDLLDMSELVDIAGTTKNEVENTMLKAELASKIAQICLLHNELEYETMDESQRDKALKDVTERTAEALRLKDENEKKLQLMLRDKQRQCESYEERIKELEQTLLEQKLSSSKDATNLDAPGGAKVEDNSQEGPGLGFSRASESMDEVSCISNNFDTKLGMLTREQPSNRPREGGDENMMDSSGILQHHLDSSMIETHREEMAHGVDKEEEEAQGVHKDGKEEKSGVLGMSLGNSSTAETCLAVKGSDDLVTELRILLVERSNELSEIETKLKAAMEENAMLSRELEARQKLLDESQMNCAHLENCLHEAREEAQTHLCAAERRASEYSALRASAVKMRGLFERLRACVYGPGSVAGFPDSLRALAQSLTNSLNENEDDGMAEFRKCMGVLAERVSFLSKHRLELLDNVPKLEAANEKLRKEFEEKEELIKTMYKKLQLEKQANKEKISFGRLEVHERAAFILNSNGHYEAISRNCPNYYLSSESVALFADRRPARPAYIVGQIVHIERQVAKPMGLPSNPYWADPSKVELTESTSAEQGTDSSGSCSGSTPYGLPVGCEFFIVTVAMLPDPAIHSLPAS